MQGLKKLLYKNAYTLLALDHRGSLINAFKKKKEANIEVAFYRFKKQVLQVLHKFFSGVLLDKEAGLKAWKEIKSKKPYLLPLEKTGYQEVRGERITKLEYSAFELKAAGATAAKLLLYFNPDYPSRKLQLKIGKQVLEQCRKAGLPLFLEIVVYKRERGVIEDNLILSSLKAFLQERIYPQVFKLQPPENFETAKKITDFLKPYGIDWIVLTQGVKFEVFQRRLKQAILAGCKGFLAGRSIWQEGIGLKGKELKVFLEKVAVPRFKKIVSIATKP